MPRCINCGSRRGFSALRQQFEVRNTHGGSDIYMYYVCTECCREMFDKPVPLSIEELRKRTSPVWVKDLLNPKESSWHFVVTRRGETLLKDGVVLSNGDDLVRNVTSGEGYGTEWLAFDCEVK